MKPNITPLTKEQEVTRLQMAEATGYILRSDGSQIIAVLATPADLIYHMSIKHEEEVEQKLTQAILKERSRVFEIVEGMKMNEEFQTEHDFCYAYDKALDDLLEALKEL